MTNDVGEEVSFWLLKPDIESEEEIFQKSTKTRMRRHARTFKETKTMETRFSGERSVELCARDNEFDENDSRVAPTFAAQP